MVTRGTVNLDSKEDAFDLRPGTVKKWVEELPLGSTGETSKRLYHALSKVNKQNNPLEHHLEFLETIAPTLSLIYPRLSRYFTDVSLPLSSKTLNVIHVTTSLLNEILFGYQTLLKILVTKKPFGWKKPFSLALHRSFIYTSQILCTQRLAYQPCSKGTWRELFWCYQQADKLGLLSKTYRQCDGNNEKTSLEYEFKKLLLLTLLSSNNLTQNNLREVYNLMPLWIKHSEIFKNEPKDKQSCFTLNLLSDVPPYLIGTRNDASSQTLDRHHLSTLKVKDLLTKFLTRISNKDSSLRIAKNTLSKTTIEALLSNWTRHHLRTEARKEGAGFVDIVTGITAIHFVLSQQDQPAYDEVTTTLPDNVIDFESTLTIEPKTHIAKQDNLNLNHFLSNPDQVEDIWANVYKNTTNDALPVAHWTESGMFKVFKFTKSILLDYCKDGYRLSVNSHMIDSLKHNELVAVREHALAPWALAQVKWLHFAEKGDVQFGIRVLSHHVLPVHVCYEANNSVSKPLPCLLGLDTKKLILFVPTLPTSLNGKKLQLDHQKQHSLIHLKNKILTTPAFDAYEILETQTLADKSSKCINSPELIINTADKTDITDNIWDTF